MGIEGGRRRTGSVRNPDHVPSVTQFSRLLGRALQRLPLIYCAHAAVGRWSQRHRCSGWRCRCSAVADGIGGGDAECHWGIPCYMRSNSKLRHRASAGATARPPVINGDIPDSGRSRDDAHASSNASSRREAHAAVGRQDGGSRLAARLDREPMHAWGASAGWATGAAAQNTTCLRPGADAYVLLCRAGYCCPCYGRSAAAECMARPATVICVELDSARQ
jgi:hypothetical protein